MIISPPQFYEVNGEACPVKVFSGTLTVGADRTVAAAVAGKRHRILGFMLQSSNTTTFSAIQLLDGATGTQLFGGYAPLSNTGTWATAEISHGGRGETSTGNKLRADISAADMFVNLYYITYTP